MSESRTAQRGPRRRFPAQAMRLLGIAAAASLVCLAATGCGDGSSGESTSSAADPDVTRSAPSTTTPAERPLDALAADLESAGLSTYPDDAGDAQAVITAGPSSNSRLVKIAYYSDSSEAKEAWQEVEAVFAEFPGKGLAATEGHVLVSIASEKPLTGSQKAAFKKVVGVVEGNE